jgi:DNA-binding IclR family transcriptional regulator
MVKDLPERHKKVLNYLVNFTKTKGRFPSTTEIALATKLRASDVAQILNVLKRKGYIRQR